MRRILVANANHSLIPWLEPTIRGLSATLTEVRSTAELEFALREDGPFDLVVTDMRLDGQSGLQIMARARALKVATPFIVVLSVHGQQLRVMVSDSTSETLSSRMVDSQNLAALSRQLVARRRRPASSN